MWSASRAAATPVERRAGSPARYSLSGMQQGRASRTAVLVCQGRAVADGLIAPGYFRDQIAVLLLSPEERAVVERARDDTPPSATRERLAWERMRACADGMVPRTVLIDDAVRGAGHRQLVIVGAGLDTRPWRLGELEDAVVFSVDHPASQADCRRRADGLDLAARRVEFVPVDLGSEPLGLALLDGGHDPSAPTTWLWEGVVPYLTGDQVEATLGALSERSAPGSTLVVPYQDRSAITRVGRRLSAFAARRAGLAIRWPTSCGAHCGQRRPSPHSSAGTGSSSSRTRTF